MEPLNTIINAFAIGVVGLLLGLQSRGLRGEMGNMRRELHDEIGVLRREFHDEIRGVRSDLTRVALAVGATAAEPPEPQGASGAR